MSTRERDPGVLAVDLLADLDRAIFKIDQQRREAEERLSLMGDRLWEAADLIRYLTKNGNPAVRAAVIEATQEWPEPCKSIALGEHQP